MPDMNQATQNDCEHYYWAHIRGGEPLSVRVCQLCRDIDWADLREQVERIRNTAMLEGQHQTAFAIFDDRSRRMSPEDRAALLRELACEGLEPGVPAVPERP